MSAFDIVPSVLHKDSMDDVLIQDANFILPAWIEAQVASKILDTFSQEKKKKFNSAYRKVDNVYVLSGIPYKLPAESVHDLMGFKFDPASFYQEEGDSYVLKARFIPRSVHCFLARCFKWENVSSLAPLFLSVFEDLKTSKVFDLTCCNTYNILNTTDNYFFYRKSHEHVPGLMLIEVARQAMYHYFYSYSGYAKGDVSISMTSLDVDFLNYTESAYAVEILTSCTNQLAMDRPRHIDFTATFYQNGRVVGSVRLTGGVMKLKLFQRLRSIPFPDDDWFSFSSRIKRECIIQDDSGQSIHVNLSQISMRGLKVIENGESLSLTKAPQQALLYVEGMGIVKFDLSGSFAALSDDSVFIELDGPHGRQAKNLREIIKAHGFYCESAFDSSQADTRSNFMRSVSQ